MDAFAIRLFKYFSAPYVFEIGPTLAVQCWTSDLIVVQLVFTFNFETKIKINRLKNVYFISNRTYFLTKQLKGRSSRLP